MTLITKTQSSKADFIITTEIVLFLINQVRESYTRDPSLPPAEVIVTESHQSSRYLTVIGFSVCRVKQAKSGLLSYTTLPQGTPFLTYSRLR